MNPGATLVLGGNVVELINYCLLPRKKFLFRLIAPAILVFLLSSMFIGEFMHGFFPSVISGRGTTATFEAQTQFVQALFSTPFYCRVGEGLVSPPHRQECTEVADKILTMGVLGGFPFLMVFFFIIFGFHELTSLYCQVSEQVSSGRISCLGKFEQGLERRDWFAALFGLQPIAIRDESGQSLRVYLSRAEKPVSPGAHVAVFDVGRWFFFPRKFGVVDIQSIPLNLSRRL